MAKTYASMIVHLLSLHCDLRSWVKLRDDRSFAKALHQFLLVALIDAGQSTFRPVNDVYVRLVDV